MKPCALLAPLVLLALVACSSTRSAEPSDSSGPVAFESIARQEQSGLTEPEHSVIRTQQAWVELWQRINVYRIPAPPAPTLDFARDMVVLVALGQRPSAGHSVEVVAIERDGSFLRVRAKSRAPAPGAVQAAVLTHPFHAVRVARSDGPVEIVVE